MRRGCAYHLKSMFFTDFLSDVKLLLFFFFVKINILNEKRPLYPVGVGVRVHKCLTNQRKANLPFLDVGCHNSKNILHIVNVVPGLKTNQNKTAKQWRSENDRTQSRSIHFLCILQNIFLFSCSCLYLHVFSFTFGPFRLAAD